MGECWPPVKATTSMPRRRASLYRFDNGIGGATFADGYDQLGLQRVVFIDFIAVGSNGVVTKYEQFANKKSRKGAQKPVPVIKMGPCRFLASRARKE